MMQCPQNELVRNDMINQIKGISDGTGIYALEQNEDFFLMPLGGTVKGLSVEQMFNIWEISGNTINKIYMRIVRHVVKV